MPRMESFGGTAVAVRKTAFNRKQATPTGLEPATTGSTEHLSLTIEGRLMAGRVIFPTILKVVPT